MIVDSSWRVETVLLWTELCLRSWFPLLHALQTDHEGLPGCKGRSFICESSSNLMRVPANRLCCPWEIQRHGTPPSTHPSTKLVLIKSYLPEEYESAQMQKYIVICQDFSWRSTQLQSGLLNRSYIWTQNKKWIKSYFKIDKTASLDRQEETLCPSNDWCHGFQTSSRLQTIF